MGPSNRKTQGGRAEKQVTPSRPFTGLAPIREGAYCKTAKALPCMETVDQAKPPKQENMLNGLKSIVEPTPSSIHPTSEVMTPSEILFVQGLLLHLNCNLTQTRGYGLTMPSQENQ